MHSQYIDYYHLYYYNITDAVVYFLKNMYNIEAMIDSLAQTHPITTTLKVFSHLVEKLSAN